MFGADENVNAYILGIDQSTQGTKAVLFDDQGAIVCRCDKTHRQIINECGWVEHDPEEILFNTLDVARRAIQQSGVPKSQVAGIGISNQRETAVAWDRRTGKPIYNAIVWQCARGTAICQEMGNRGVAPEVKARTGLTLSPYFSAAKLAWIMQNCPESKSLAEQGNLCCGNIDSWLLFRLTNGNCFLTDHSNASRTQLYNIRQHNWDPELCDCFGISRYSLPQICDSNYHFADTDLMGFLDRPIPIHTVMGDSHAALFGQGCHKPGMIKATYGTGSSVMMNIGTTPISDENIVTSIAWSMNGQIQYVLEGNINYTGAVISWLKDDLKLIDTSKVGPLAMKADPNDKTYMVPAFSGLGAPYWNSECTAIITGMTRSTGKAEVVRAAEECIAYQIADNIEFMVACAKIPLKELRVDGGPTKDAFLMQFQSDILRLNVEVPHEEELSAIGVAYSVGIALGVYNKATIFNRIQRTTFTPTMSQEMRNRKYQGWKAAVQQVLGNSRKE